jgi:hypothetical protein
MCLSQVFAPSVFVLALAQRRHARVVHRIQPAHLGETPFRHRTARRCAPVSPNLNHDLRDQAHPGDVMLARASAPP